MERRVALVTGVEGVLGAEIVKHLARNGYAVALACSDDFERARALERLCALQGVETLLLSGDIHVNGTCSKWVADIITFFQRLDVLICNVGYHSKWLEVRDDDEFLQGMQQELGDLTELMKSASQPMEHFKQGRIVALSPPCGLVNNSRDSLLSSSVDAMTRAMAKKFAVHNITVNSVLPGVIDLPDYVVSANSDALLDIPLGRLGKPSEITDAIGFLLSNAASYVTGMSLPVDGGVRL